MSIMTLLSSYSCWSDSLLPDLGKQHKHYFECHLVSRLPQVLLLHCVLLHPTWLHQCHPACQQWHLPYSDLPPTRHHLHAWGGGCEEGRQSKRTESKGRGKLYYWGWRWVENAANLDSVTWQLQLKWGHAYGCRKGYCKFCFSASYVSTLFVNQSINQPEHLMLHVLYN